MDIVLWGAGEDTYVKCEKKIQDDIILITENPKDQIILEKTSLDSQKNWNGNGLFDDEAGSQCLCI